MVFFFAGLLATLLVYFVMIKNKNNQKILNRIETLKAKGEPLYIVDVRQPSEFANGGVNGAINIPLGEINSRIKDFEGNKNIIVYCQSGIRSGQAVSVLAKNNIMNVINAGSFKNANQALG